MTLPEAAAKIQRTADVAKAIAKWMEIGAKKPKRNYYRKIRKEDSRQMPQHPTSPK